MSSHHDEWVKYPVGKLGKGAWCDCCKRYTARHSTTEVIAVRKGKILLIKRNTDPQKGWWSLVGGYVDWEETVEECAKREFEEETGLQVKTIRFLGVYSDPERDLDGRQNVGHCFVVEPEGNERRQETEVEKIAWFDLYKLPEQIAFDHRQMIEDYRATLA